MKKIYLLYFFLIFSLNVRCELKNYFPLGATYSWEHNNIYAKNTNKEYWEFVEYLLKTLKSLNFDTIWVLNIGIDDAVKLCEIAEKYNIMVLPTISPLYNLHNYSFKNIEELKNTARMVYEKIGNKKSLLGYVLVDEPRNYMVKEMDLFRGILKELDPKRDSVVVTMNRDTHTYIEKSKFPVAVFDCYPFGGDLSPNIPNPSPVSQNYYRYTVGNLSEEANRFSKFLWVIPQCFAEIWGAYWYDENKNVVIEPGSYYHWRMPTIEEIRWQIWEGLRTNCKGIIFFNLFSTPLWDGKGEMPESMKKTLEYVKEQKLPQVKTQIKTNMGSSLLYIDGSPTPQMEEIGRIFGILKKHKDLLLSLEKNEFPFAYTEEKFKIESFISKNEKDTGYLIVVNDDVKDIRKEKISLLPNVKEIEDIIKNKKIEIKEKSVGELNEAIIELNPGEGTILRIKFEKDKRGFVLLKEDFSLPAITVETQNIIIEPVRRGFLTGWDWIAQREKGLPPDKKGIITILRVSELRGPLWGILNSKDIEVFLFIEGNFKGPESMVVEGEDKDGKKTWLCSNNYNLPVKIPKDTKKINIIIVEGVSIKSITFFAIQP